MFQFSRSPLTPEGKRLYFRQHPKYDPLRFNPALPLNILIQWRLYRFTFLGFNLVQRRWIVQEMFSDYPIRPGRVGKILKAILQYPCGSMIYKKRGANWRFLSHIDLQYGLEFLMLDWITDPRLVGKIPLIPSPIETREDFEQLLCRIREQSEGEDLLNLHLIHPRWDIPRKGHGVHWNKDCLLR